MASSNLLFSERLKDFTNEENKRNKAKEESENKKIEKKLKKRQMGGVKKFKKKYLTEEKKKEEDGAKGAGVKINDIVLDWDYAAANMPNNSTILKTKMTKRLIDVHFYQNEVYENIYNKKFIELYSNIIIEMYKEKEKVIENEDIKKLIIQYFVLRNIEELIEKKSFEFKLKDFNEGNSQVINNLKEKFKAMSNDDFKKKFDIMTDFFFLIKKFKKN